MPTEAPAGDTGGTVAVPTSTSTPPRNARMITPAQSPVAPACATSQPGSSATQSSSPAGARACGGAPIRYGPAPRTLRTDPAGTTAAAGAATDRPVRVPPAVTCEADAGAA